MRTMQILAALMIVLFIAGCGGAPSETNEDSSAQASGDQLGADNEQAKPAGETATKGLKDILVEDIKYKATYKLTSDGETSTMTMIYDYPKIAQRTTVDGVESLTIIDGDSMIACTNDGGWQCFKIGGSETESGSEVATSSKTEDYIREGDVEPLMIGSCSVAGEKGQKYEVKFEEYTSSICYTTDGIMLEMITEDSSMVATSVSRSVSASEFEPPAEPQDLSLMMQNIPGMTDE